MRRNSHKRAESHAVDALAGKQGEGQVDNGAVDIEVQREYLMFSSYSISLHKQPLKSVRNMLFFLKKAMPTFKVSRQYMYSLPRNRLLQQMRKMTKQLREMAMNPENSQISWTFHYFCHTNSRVQVDVNYFEGRIDDDWVIGKFAFA